MAMVTSQSLSFDTKDRLRDASFSSYLNSSEKTIARKLAKESSSVTPNSLFLRGKKTAGDDGEIDAFGAEKYFNGVADEEKNTRVSNNNGRMKSTRYPKNAPIDTSPGLGHGVQPGTPSIHSESSWNSQSGLLHHSGKRNPNQRKPKNRNAKNLLSSIGCSCSCNGRKSVDINEQNEVQGEMVGSGLENSANLARIESGLNPWVMEEIHCKKIDEGGNGLNREDCFTFPILLNSKNPNPLFSQENEDEKQRNSLEVFGSPALNKKNKWEWETNSRAEGFEIPRNSDGMYYNDNDSDASSDLFEIESFTNSGNSILMRQGSEGNNTSACVTPTTCYAPSEVSIEWSVVTATAAEFSSVISDSEELKDSEGGGKAGPNGRRTNGGGKAAEKRRTGIPLSCKSYKAVRVVGDAYVRSGKGNPDPRSRDRSARDGRGIYGGKGK